MPMLLPPRVTAPLSECSGRVEVKGQVPGATVHVFADDEPIVEALSSFSELQLDLPVSLAAGASVIATQTLGSDESTPSPEPVIVQAQPPSIGSLVFESTIYECGACVALSGAIPGATLEVHALNGPDPGLRGTRTAEITGNTKVSLEPPADTETNFIARQVACGESGPDTPMQAVFPEEVFN